MGSEIGEKWRRLRAELVQFSAADAIWREEVEDKLTHAPGGLKELVAEVEAIGHNLLVKLDAYFAGVPTRRFTVYRRWPKDWWQAFKERWFPSWALKRWPVEYEEIDIDEIVAYAVCPHVDIPKPGKHLEWLRRQADAPVVKEEF